MASQQLAASRRRSTPALAAMRNAIIYLSVLGIVSGLVFIAGPWVFGVPGSSPEFVYAPTLLGVALILTHWNNIKRARLAAGHTLYGGALSANAALLIWCLIGGMWLYERDSARPRFPVAALLYIVLLIVPLAANTVYVVVARIRK